MVPFKDESAPMAFMRNAKLDALPIPTQQNQEPHPDQVEPAPPGNFWCLRLDFRVSSAACRNFRRNSSSQ
jgi:hypothetical protein